MRSLSEYSYTAYSVSALLTSKTVLSYLIAENVMSQFVIMPRTLVMFVPVVTNNCVN